MSAAFDSRRNGILERDSILREGLRVLCLGWPWKMAPAESLEMLLLWMTPSYSTKKVPLTDLLFLLKDLSSRERLNCMVSEYLEGTRSSLLPLDAALRPNAIIYKSGGPYKVQINCYLVDRGNVVGDGTGLTIEIPLTSSAQFRKEGVYLQMLYRYIDELEFQAEAPEGSDQIAKKARRVQRRQTEKHRIKREP